MKKIIRLPYLLAVALALLTACDQLDLLDLFPYPENDSAAEAVFTMTNALSSNEVVAFKTGADGKLTQTGKYSTAGRGSGPRTDLPIGRDPIVSQYSVVLSPDNKHLFVVNAGSNTVTSFRVNGAALERASVIASGGTYPVSLTVSPDNKLLYVVNSGGADTDNVPGITKDSTTGSIQGFYIGSNGSLTAIPGSNQPVSGKSSSKGTIAFSPDGRILAVLEKARNSSVVSYVVDANGVAGPPRVFDTRTSSTASAGEDPFSGVFDNRGFLHTVNLNLTPPPNRGPAVNGATITTYKFDRDGQVSIVNAAVPLNATAGCWIRLSADGRYLYAVATDSRAICGFALGIDGSLTPLTPTSVVAIAGDPGPRVGTADAVDPLDITFTREYAYNIIPIQGSIQSWKVEANGLLTLQPTSGVSGLPVTTQGIAATNAGR